MTIAELKNYLTNLTPDYDNYELVIRDISEDEHGHIAYDTHIAMIAPDEVNEHICMMDKYSSDVFDNMIIKNN